MARWNQIVLMSAILAGSWLGMQAIHELGHVLGAWMTGGVVQRVVLHPLQLSRTDTLPNPWPLLVAWMGPAVGSLAPLCLWMTAAGLKASWAFTLRFFAGFCLIANGLYLGLGSFGKIGDAGDLLTHGAAGWHLWGFGILVVPAGLYLWHGQGKHFGLGRGACPVRPAIAHGCLLVCLMLVILGLALTHTGQS